MTDTTDDPTRRPTTDRPRMRDVTHVRPDHDPRAWHWFARGPTLVADGGRPPARRGTDRSGDGAPDDGRPDEAPGAGRDVADESLRDVSHEPVHGGGANRVWERGEDADDDEREA